ncbi:MAG: MFS transporter [Calditrichaceae bacterium]
MASDKRSPWWWLPSLYYAEGMPYVVVMMVSVVMYKRMGISNTDIALYTSWLYLPWVIKPLWSPVVDLLKTRRLWIISMQLIIGAGLGGVALTLPLPGFFKFTLGFLWLLAFSSATHDIAADGFYMLGLTKHQQAWFVGVRSTFYRLAMITGQGVLIIFAGFIESHSGFPDTGVVVKTVNQELAREQTPDKIPDLTVEDQNGIIITPKVLTISSIPRPKEVIDSLIHFAKLQNSLNGHAKIEVLQNPEISGSDPPEAAKTDKSSRIETFLKKYFGKTKPKKNADLADNAGLIFLKLSAPPEPGKEVVVNFGRESGDKSISLPGENRFVFNQSNWNRPAVAVIQADHRLKHSAGAYFKAQSGNIPLAWSLTFTILTVLFVIFFIYHKYMLPFPDSDRAAKRGKADDFIRDFFQTFLVFFKKDKIIIIISFLLLYRFAEAQLVKLAAPFLLDSQEAGGLALTTGQVGVVYGTAGLIMLVAGGLLGGFVAARHGLKFWLWPMAIAMNLPNVVYIYLAYAQPDNFLIINLCVAIEQFGYGFGFTAFMLYMIYVSEGTHKTAHFAITTGFMALGMMIPGMFSGWLQELIGYQHFFIWILLATIPGFILLTLIPLDSEFGKKTMERQ